MNTQLDSQIHEANILVHKTEAAAYEWCHPEIWSPQEQKRLNKTLKTIDGIIKQNNKLALDFGAGSGNLTEKLLKLGYTVWAVDISPEMCNKLAKKLSIYFESQKLRIFNAPIEDINFENVKFDLICCYSVLHHLPNYSATIKTLAGVLKKGGLMYLDHEVTPYYWKREKFFMKRMVKSAYFFTNNILNKFYLFIHHKKDYYSSTDTSPYKFADYWALKQHHLNHDNIHAVFHEEKFTYFKRNDYHMCNGWLFNPFSSVYQRTCNPEESFWLAMK